MPAERYRRQLEAARDVALMLTASQERELLNLLEEYAREIEARIATGLRFGTDTQVLREVTLLVDAMTRDLAASVGDGVRLTSRQLAEIQTMATAELIASAGSTLSVAATFSGTGARAAQAVLSRPELAEAFVTIRGEAAAVANRIIRRGMVRGAPAAAIARELRQYIRAPDSLLEGYATLLADRRRIGYRAIEALGYEPTEGNLAMVRREASQIAYRASTIARTEIMNAEAEVMTQGAVDSPVVALVEIRLSYRHSEVCACEPIAKADLYGFGPGRYDPRTVPPRPHPRCWCIRRHVLRAPSEWGDPRGPVPELVGDLEGAAEDAGLSPSAARAFVAAVEAGQRARAPEMVEA